jgi:hypothetical protein
MATVLNSMMCFRALQLLQVKKPPKPTPNSARPREKPDFKSCVLRGVRHSYGP